MSYKADSCREQARRLAQDPPDDRSANQNGRIAGRRCGGGAHSADAAATDEQTNCRKDRKDDDPDGSLFAAAVLEGRVEAALDGSSIDS
jgi:hypothetical protein